MNLVFTIADSPRKVGAGSDHEDVLGEWDDADDDMYAARLAQWCAKRGAVDAADVVPGQAPGARAPAAGGGSRGDEVACSGAAAAGGAAEDVLADVEFEGGLRVPGDIYNRLYDYQKTGGLFPVQLVVCVMLTTGHAALPCRSLPLACCSREAFSIMQGAADLQRCPPAFSPHNRYNPTSLFLHARMHAGLKWMWELHTQRAGGIIGDEMGLGKTVQVTPPSPIDTSRRPLAPQCIQAPDCLHAPCTVTHVAWRHRRNTL